MLYEEIHSPEEMAEYFSEFPDAIENTVKIAEKCNYDFEFGVTKLPNYDVPEEYETHYDYFKELCYTGIKRRYGENPSDEVMQRLEYEISVIKQMGYVDYFLIVWDYINYAKSVGIPVGPGRGSGAGSIAAYAIGITDIDPLKYGLLFERFLNPERISMPDFDVDFCYERRGDVIKYVENKYGKDHVSQIITFGTMAARMVIRDVGRVLDFPYSDTDKRLEATRKYSCVAFGHTMQALQFIKLIPRTEIGIRRFCLLASEMAVMTLRNIYENPLFREPKEIKISHRDVKNCFMVTTVCASSNFLLNIV